MSAATTVNRHTLLTSSGRAALPFRRRVGAALAVVVVLHLVGLSLLTLGVVSGTAGAVTVALAATAYLRGLVHAFDFDHVAMIDNSTRKFVAEGRSPASVGLAFSLGHSTVVILTGILVIAGAGFIRTALDDSSGAAHVLGVIGVSVSGLYLVLVAVANLATFTQAWKLRGALRRDPHLVVPPDALTPRGPAAMLMTAPLRRIRHPWHVYVIGFLFSLGFDTSSQIGVLVLTAGAALAGAPLVSLLCLPLLFTAAMTLGDTVNGLVMLKMYTAAQEDPARKVTYNLLVTGVGIASGLLVGALAAAALLSEELGISGGLVGALTSLETEHAGFVLAGLFAVVFAVSAVAWKRARA
ncbi:high-affinity nickel-transport protein [Quadrisphaera granulorum]|uniref:Nickel/cobalt efflux system n=1 Tax=Quadrisphaera granulorum TaxID=317664 RepID=A0A316A6C8_9ACTN|nr:nickel transporter [Quadrisphaera granulorum]PWJ53133.1 high-affinity nickel-transport protein [Quadrisphaera granulorum]SZE97065.1 high-affinity nickel-transport protein [Quadrisphaera granulorum]